MNNKYKIPNNFFDDMEIDEILDFPEVPVLYTLKNNKTGKIYLSYLDKFIEVNLEQRFVVHISNQELNDLKRSKIKIDDVYLKENIFVLSLNQLNGKAISSYKFPSNIFENEFGKINAGYIFYDELDCLTETNQSFVKHNEPILMNNKIKNVRENLNLNILYLLNLNLPISRNSLEGFTNYA